VIVVIVVVVVMVVVVVVVVVVGLVYARGSRVRMPKEWANSG